MDQTINNISDYTLEELNSTSESLYQISTILLNQVVNLLKFTILTDEQLSFTSILIPSSTIGKHLRHVHDHFRLLLDSLPSSTSSSSNSLLLPLRLSYDHRSRNTQSETSHSACLESFYTLLERLERQVGNNNNNNNGISGKGKGKEKIEGSREMLVEAVTPERMGLKSSFGRELWFTCLHAVHHFSLLRVIAVGELNLYVPPEFGVAPSTLAYRSKL